MLIFVLSCGQSAEEKAAKEKARTDSIVKATEEATRNKIEMAQSLKDSISKGTNVLNMLEKRLVAEKADLEVAKDRLVKIKEFHFGRTAAEREQQIKNQIVAIDEIEKTIESLDSKITLVNQKIEQLKVELQAYK
jgi:hypothetical protein